MRFGNVGERIKQKRREKHLTQAQLANMIGKTESSIRKYEKNLVSIPDSVMIEIANALGTTVHYLDGIEKAQKDFQSYKSMHYLIEEQGFHIDYEIDEPTAHVTYKGKTYTVSFSEVDACESDIKKYIKFRLLELLDK